MFKEFFCGKKILVTGGAGTVGDELVAQLLEFDVSSLVVMDNNESDVFFSKEKYKAHSEVDFFLGDVRDQKRLRELANGVDIIFHLAALKHVVLCEESPTDAVQTNIDGTSNIIEVAKQCNVERVVFTSSDKAVNPTNVMGTSKLMGERLITAANAHRRSPEDTVFFSTRFGNVLGSKGSVVPIFKRQIDAGKPITITHPMMTRFIMTIEQAVKLVIESAVLGIGGEVFVTKMPVVNIKDISTVMLDLLLEDSGMVADYPVEIIGAKPGEKMYEELMSQEETQRTMEMERFFVVLPAFRSIYNNIDYKYTEDGKLGIVDPYVSSPDSALKVEELKEYFLDNKILENMR